MVWQYGAESEYLYRSLSCNDVKMAVVNNKIFMAKRAGVFVPAPAAAAYNPGLMRPGGSLVHHTVHARMKLVRGFTLIELLVVISIIGLLSSMVMVALNNARMKARYASSLADMAQIGKAAELYNTSGTTGYPADVGPDAMPGELVPYLSKWPRPQCGGWTYDWENWAGHAIRITMRRADVAGIYFYCVQSLDGDCGASYAGGMDITQVATKVVTCRE